MEVAQYLLENGVSANSPGVADNTAWLVWSGYGVSPEMRRKLVRLMLDHGLRFSDEHLERFRKDPKAAAFARELGIAL